MAGASMGEAPVDISLLSAIAGVRGGLWGNLGYSKYFRWDRG